MNDDEALDYAYELRDHLYTFKMLGEIEPNLKSDLDALAATEDRIRDLNRKLDDLTLVSISLDKEHQFYNLRYGLGESHPDFGHAKSMRKEIWEKKYQAQEDRKELFGELQSQQNFRDQLKREVGEIQKKFMSTQEFLHLNKNVISLYSIVTINLSGEPMIFSLATESQLHRVSMDRLSILSIDSHIGTACIGKRCGESFSYVAPSGLTMAGEVIATEFPTAEQMDNLISAIEARPPSQRPVHINPFELFERYGSNNSRNRKGG